MLIDSLPRAQDQLHDMVLAVKRCLDDAGVGFHLGYGTALGAVRHEDHVPWDSDCDLLVKWQAYSSALDALKGLPTPYTVAYDANSYPHEFARVVRSDIGHEYLHIDLFPLVPTFDRAHLARLHLAAGRLVARVVWARGQAVKQRRDRAIYRRLRAWVTLLVLGPVPRSVLRRLFGRLADLRSPGDFVLNLAGSYGGREVFPTRWFDEPEWFTLRGEQMPVPRPADAYLRHLYGEYHTLPLPETVAAELQFFDEWCRPVLSTCSLRFAGEDEPTPSHGGPRGEDETAHHDAD